MPSITNRMRRRVGEDQGFTLVELLVVILIIGILAAIAIPTFLGQRSKAQDASAKSNARNVVSLVEACFTTTENYANCTSATALAADGSGNSGLNIVASPAAGTDQVGVASPGTGAAGGAYTVTAQSKGGNVFTISKSTAGVTTRACSDATDSTKTSNGACNNGTW